MSTRAGRRRNRQLPAWETALFTVIVVGVFFAALNFLVELAEDLGVIETRRGIDDHVHYVDEPLFEDDGAGFLRTTDYARESMAPARFRAEKGDAWRLFILGASFAMGVPYAVQSDGYEEQFGSIASWLREDVARLLPERPVEVLNFAAPSTTSHHVRLVTARALEHDVDAIFVASCNNEGNVSPSAVNETLRKTGTFRLITRLVVPPAEHEQRSYYFSQDEDTERVQTEFRANIEAIAALAAQKNIPLFLATLPTNLRLVGDGAGPGGTGEEPEAPPAACVLEGRAALVRGDSETAERLFRDCDDVEALRELGMALLLQARYPEADQALSQYMELVPRNRCRPSLNAIIREVAAAHDHVTLVDLEAAARTASPHGLPGDELFVDSCHMTWQGYALMERTLLRALVERGLLPSPEAAGVTLPDQDRLAHEQGIADAPQP